MEKKLSLLKPQETGKISKIFLEEPKYLKGFSLGIIKNNQIKCMYQSPFQSPICYKINGCMFSLRKEDADDILVEV